MTVTNKAPDRRLGERLVEILKSHFTGRIQRFEFNRDEYVISDSMEQDKSDQLWVSSDTVLRTRLSRGHWQRGVQLTVKLFTAARPDNDDQWLESWLIDWDSVLDVIEEATPLGVKALEIENDDRYDREYLGKRSRLLIVASVLYPAVPVGD